MASAPSSRRRSTFSLNTAQAIAIVASPSRLSSSAADEAGVETSPSISRTGPATPPERMTSSIHGQSPIERRFARRPADEPQQNGDQGQPDARPQIEQSRQQPRADATARS